MPSCPRRAWQTATPAPASASPTAARCVHDGATARARLRIGKRQAERKAGARWRTPRRRWARCWSPACSLCWVRHPPQAARARTHRRRAPPRATAARASAHAAPPQKGRLGDAPLAHLAAHPRVAAAAAHADDALHTSGSGAAVRAIELVPNDERRTERARGSVRDVVGESRRRTRIFVIQTDETAKTMHSAGKQKGWSVRLGAGAEASPDTAKGATRTVDGRDDRLFSSTTPARALPLPSRCWPLCALRGVCRGTPAGASGAPCRGAQHGDSRVALVTSLPSLAMLAASPFDAKACYLRAARMSVRAAARGVKAVRTLAEGASTRRAPGGEQSQRCHFGRRRKACARSAALLGASASHLPPTELLAQP